MSDLLLTQGGDLSLSQGRLSLLSTLEESTQQRLIIKLRTYKGEWYLDLAKGIPYFQSILRRGNDAKDIADTLFKNALIKDEGVLSVKSFESTLSKSGAYSLSFEVTTVRGEIITVQQDINF